MLLHTHASALLRLATLILCGSGLVSAQTPPTPPSLATERERVLLERIDGLEKRLAALERKRALSWEACPAMPEDTVKTGITQQPDVAPDAMTPQQTPRELKAGQPQSAEPEKRQAAAERALLFRTRRSDAAGRQRRRPGIFCARVDTRSSQGRKPPDLRHARKALIARTRHLDLMSIRRRRGGPPGSG